MDVKPLTSYHRPVKLAAANQSGAESFDQALPGPSAASLPLAESQLGNALIWCCTTFQLLTA